jgi:3alpha(or 20beta)-hydroxysteroid dehydrogenase
VPNRLDGKVALISGAARGMGASHAQLFAEEGARVVIGDIRDDLGEALAERLRASGFDAQYVHLDVTSPDDWQNAVDVAIRAFGRLNVVVNNAGIEIVGGVLADGYDHVIAVNQTGTYHGMRAAIPALLATGGGSIVNIASINGYVADAGYTRTTGEVMSSLAYCTSKAAVRMMTRCVAAEYATQNIRVNTVCPGVVETDMSDDLGVEFDKGQLNEIMDAITKAHPMKRKGLPLEISNAVLFLASDDSSYMTGSDLIIDGGLLAI